MKTAMVYLQSGSHTGLNVFVSSARVIGVKAKRFMNKTIQYSDEPVGDIELIADFLPSPDELALTNQNTKVTISLGTESVAYFKDAAKRHHMQYQKMIRPLLDEYVQHQKSAGK
jgi:predicted DNA binding CopG/RHH family protein